MKTRDAVTDEKLRGGFYTPSHLVDLCLDRLREHLDGHTGLRVLEPSAGDGAFVRGLGAASWARERAEVTAVELMPSEAAAVRQAMAETSMPGLVIEGSVLPWALSVAPQFDAAVGNPPFLRFQFVSDADRASATALGDALDIPMRGVSNLWIPVLLAALSRLRPGGAFAFVVPSEILTGLSATSVREWLLRECNDLTLDLLGPGSFPGVLQEVVVLSGARCGHAAPTRRVRFVDHGVGDLVHEWTHEPSSGASWTRYLLTAPELEAFERAVASADVRPLGEIVAFEVSIVTGANAYFCAATDTVDAFDLTPWARPLLPRIRHAPGLIYTADDHRHTENSGARSWLLDFGADMPEPMGNERASAYIRDGEAQGLPARYKCRVRSPWYRVPNVVGGILMLSKRSHHHPRVVLNECGVLTTDTIYRGRLLADIPAPSVAATFHNSLTLLSAELEGRSFGGGVLELVPSEIARLALPVVPSAASELPVLDGLLRAGDGSDLIARTDEILIGAGAIDDDVMALLAGARERLMGRRLERAGAQAPNWERDPVAA